MSSRYRAMVDLLTDLFSESGALKVFVGLGECGALIVRDLPATTVSIGAMAAAVTDAVEAHGVGADLLARLSENFPRRKEIAEVIARWLGEQSKQADSPRYRSAYRIRMAERASRLPRGFGGGGFTVADVFVDPPLVMIAGPRAAENRKVVGSLDEALAQAHRQWSVIGDPGSGKSLLLQATTLRLLEDPSRTPLLLRVSELAKAGGFWPAVDAAVEDNGSAFVRGEAQAGRLVLLLDGYDELGTEAAKKLVLQATDEIAGNYVVVAGREIGFRDQPLGSAFVGLRLGPFTREHARRLLDLRCRPDVAAELIQRLQRGGMIDFLSNPLLLTLVALKRESVAPTGQGSVDRLHLYAYALRLMTEPRLHKHPGSHPSASFADPVCARRLLARVALVLHRSPSERVPLRELLAEASLLGHESDEEIARFVSQAQAITDLIQTNDDLLDEVEVSFPHRTFREYCCALAIEEQALTDGCAAPGIGSLITHACGQPQLWAEVLAMACGLLSRSSPRQAEELLQAITRASPDLALRALAYAEHVDGETVCGVLERILGLERRREAWRERVQIFGKLSTLVSDPRAVIRLCRKYRETTQTTHGVDLFWILHVLHGMKELPYDDVTRAEACAELERVFSHIPADARVTVEEQLKPNWREIPGGEFVMGSPAEENGHYEDEAPLHPVQIAGSFWMQALLITNEMYERFDPGHREDREVFGYPPSCLPEEQDQFPVYNICWYEAMAFAMWQGARLPTEIEWEYACRAGSRTRFWCGEEDAAVAEVGWVIDNAREQPHVVGRPPSARGTEHPWKLLDLHGNVFEWCLDAWSPNYDLLTEVVVYDAGSVSTLYAEALESHSVMRGGSWRCLLRHVRSANRASSSRSARLNDQGIRLVRVAPSRA